MDVWIEGTKNISRTFHLQNILLILEHLVVFSYRSRKTVDLCEILNKFRIQLTYCNFLETYTYRELKLT